MSIRDEVEAVNALKDTLATLGHDDPDLLADSIEGETSLFEIFDRMLMGNVFDASHVEACEIAIGVIKARQKRFETRIESRRAMIEQAMMMCDLPKAERPLATLSIQTRAPQVIITDEAEIPSKFWKASDPKLDKKAIGDALKAGEDVAGACLSNKAPSLTIRSK
jgi:hypothetical protein